MKIDTSLSLLLTMLAAQGLVALGMCIERHIKGEPAHVIEMTPIISYIHDTTYIDRPVPVKEYITRTDTVSIENSRIIIQKDSTMVIPIETKVYESDKFRAVVEGYKPRLTELELYTEHMQITQPVAVMNSRWSIGVTAGPVLTGDGIKPGLSVGLTYNLKTFPARGR